LGNWPAKLNVIWLNLEENWHLNYWHEKMERIIMVLKRELLILWGSKMHNGKVEKMNDCKFGELNELKLEMF
jgi:hypothetical protein